MRLFGRLTINLGQRLLDGRGAFDRIHSTAEFGQEAVSHQLEDAPAMARDGRLNQLDPPLTQALEGTRLILLHKTAVADHVSGQNGCETTLCAFLSHAPSTPSEDAGIDCIGATCWSLSGRLPLGVQKQTRS